MNTYTFVCNLSDETGIDKEHIDLILTEMTNSLNARLLSGKNGIGSIVSFAKKRQGIVDIINDVVEKTGLPDEEVSCIINKMCSNLHKSLKTGGIKQMMQIIKSIKKQSTDLQNEEKTESEDN